MNSVLAIETRHLRKLYGAKIALEDLTLDVRPGEAVGLLGPNGAGKSTTIKLLLGLAHPSGGGARMLGRPVGDIDARRRIGFLPEHFQFQDWLSGAEVLRLHGRLYGMDEAALRRRVPALLDRVGLDGQGRKPLRAYSKGMRQRIGLAQALLNDPDLIFLDEPTSGLDPLGRMLVREIIREQRDRGAAVLLNSHLLGEVEASCDRVVFIQHGRLLESQSLHAAAVNGPVRLRVRAENVPDSAWAAVALNAAPARLSDGAWQLELAERAAVPRLMRALVQAGADVHEVTPLAWTLEETFVRVIGATGGPD